MPEPSSIHAKSFLLARHGKVRKALTQLKLDGLVFTDLSDLHYLTNFGTKGAVGLIYGDSLFVIVDSDSATAIKEQSPWVSGVTHDGNVAEKLAQIIQGKKLQRVAYEVTQFTQWHLMGLDGQLKKLGAKTELIAVKQLLLTLRKIKDEVEVASIRASVKLAQAAFRAVTKTIESTFSENYLSGLLLFELQSRGADDAGFTPTVASAESSGSYWHQSNNKPMRNNAPVSINWGARVRGYCSDLTRTIYFGRPAQKFEKMHEAVLSSRQQVLEFIRPGVTTRQVDKVGRSVLEKKGFKADRAFGHGVGRDANELPILSSWSPEEELQPGMVIAIEPGIHVHGVGGVRIEDMVLVTHGGCEVLSDLDLTYAGSRIE